MSLEFCVFPCLQPNPPCLTQAISQTSKAQDNVQCKVMSNLPDWFGADSNLVRWMSICQQWPIHFKYFVNVMKKFGISAISYIYSDPLLAADTGLYSILILHDLSSAFDRVDHDILNSRLKNNVGINDVALDWFTSHLLNRSFFVMLGGTSSACAPLFCEVLQGSISGPLSFSFYMLPLGKIMP